MLATVNTKKYNVSLFPQDFAYDLVATLDIFLPLKCVMEIVQSIHCKPWKPAILMKRLIDHYQSMSFNRDCVRNAPLVEEYITSIESYSFKGE